jgi:hypothetical protein
MNNNTFINLGMQVNNEYNWPERSLSYLCRSFDQLRTSEEYANAGPAIHIGFLDFTPFPEHPEFYPVAAETLYNLNSDETIRALEDYNRQQSAIKYRFKELNAELKKVTSEKQQLAYDNQQLTSKATIRLILFSLNHKKILSTEYSNFCVPVAVLPLKNIQTV